MKGFMEETIFIVVEVILIVIFTVLLVRSVGAAFNPDKEVAVLNTELLRSKINEACLTRQPVTLEKFSLTQPKPSKILGLTDFLPSFAISGSGAADPHYVLYYESFPVGEAIGWEIYDKFETRFIAPFDYSKVKPDTPLKAKPGSISGDAANEFMKAMRDYQTDVMNVAGTCVSSAEGQNDKGMTLVSYIPANGVLPQNDGWEPILVGNIDHYSLSIPDARSPIAGKLSINTHHDAHDSIMFKKTEQEPSATSFLEVELSVFQSRKPSGIFGYADPEKIFMSLQNKPYRADLVFREDKILLRANSNKEYVINTKDGFHKYRLEMKGNLVNVYVDYAGESSVPVMTDTAKSGTENAFVWGAGNPDSPGVGVDGTTKSYWGYVKYAGDKVSSEGLSGEELHKCANKPILINNIVLNDYLNVIPTEKPVPPGSDVAKSTAQVGNAGQWNGDRFEFSDYLGITKEERAYIKYEPCGDNALCLKTRDAVQRFPLDARCDGAKFIQMEYDARDLDWEDLVPAMWVVGDVAALKALSSLKVSASKTAAATVSTTARRLAPTAIEGMDDEYIRALETDTMNVIKKPGLLSRTMKKMGSFGKGILKTTSKKTLGKLPGKLKLVGQLVILSDIFLGHGQEAIENLLKSTLAYRSSEFYIASPCQLQDGKITIEYVPDCQKECEEGVSYPLYEYSVDYDGTKTITNVGEHFTCLASIGKDKDEPADVTENVACIKIKMDDVKRRDFCWTNNPILPEEKGIWNKLKGFLPDKSDILSAGISCGIGLAFGGPLGCLGGIATDVVINAAGDTLDTLGITQGGLKGEAFTRMGALPVTETTSYIENGNVRTVQMEPTSIGGNALKRLGEVASNYVNIDWAWPG